MKNNPSSFARKNGNFFYRVAIPLLLLLLTDGNVSAETETLYNEPVFTENGQTIRNCGQMTVVGSPYPAGGRQTEKSGINNPQSDDQDKSKNLNPQRSPVSNETQERPDTHSHAEHGNELKQDAEEKGRGGEKPGTRNPKPETNNPKPVVSGAGQPAIQNLSSTKIGDPNSKITSIPQSTILEDYGKLPLYFIRNDGQIDERVKYYEKGSGHTMYFTEEGVYLSLVSKDQEAGGKRLADRDKRLEGRSKKRVGWAMPTEENTADKKSEIQNPNSEIINSAFRIPQPAFVKLLPLGANKHPEIIAEGLQEGKVNYFIGSSDKWKTNIPTYSAVVYKEMWPGIDIKFYGNNRQLEYDIIVKPGADPSQVRFAYEGIEELRVNKDGDLEIILADAGENGSGGETGNLTEKSETRNPQSEMAKIIQKKPYVYQEINGRRVEIEGCFVIQEARCEMQIPPPDPLQRGTDIYPPLTDISYCPPLAGVEGVEGTGIRASLSTSQGKQGTRVRPAAHSHAGRRKEAIYPPLAGAQGVEEWDKYFGGQCPPYLSQNPLLATRHPSRLVYGFQIASYDKRHPLIIDPTLAYSTYLGGSGVESGDGIAVDGSGYAYITGYTGSTNFGTSSAYQGTYGGGTYDAFVTKFGTSGASLVYSTYLGGSNIDEGNAIAVDSSGYVYVTGETRSSNFPTASAYQGTRGGDYDAFVTKLGTSGASLEYSTYLGGSSFDFGYGIAVDSSGYAYVTGISNSSNFPTASAYQGTHGGGTFDAFVTKVGTSGSSLVYSTYLGGSSSDSGNGIAVDGSGYVYITGYTASTNFGTASAYQGTYGGSTDAFVTKFGTSGTSLVYSTYLGGSGTDYGYAITVDGSGYVYLTGYTESSNFPTASAYQGTHGGGIQDAFVTKFGASGSSLVYSTYLGGSSADYGYGIAVDGSGYAYVTGYTASSNFPTASAYQGTHGGGTQDTFVTKFGASGSNLVYSTYLGGSSDDYGYDIAVDVSGYAYVMGEAGSSNFPTASAYDGSLGGSTDAFVTKLAPTPYVVTGTVIGVTSSTSTLYGTVSALGLSTTAWFNYGISSGSYTGTSSTQSVTGENTTVSIGISGLSSGTTYYYRIAAQNGAGTSYGSEASFTTTSAAVVEPTPQGDTLTVTSTSPASGAAGVGTNTTVAATFSMLMNGSTLTKDTFKLSGGGNDVAGSVSTSGYTATFTPSISLAYDTTYTATITKGAQAANYAGTTLDSEYSWSFTTESAPAVTPTPTPSPSPSPTPSDTTAPSGSITINNNDAYTQSADVTLNLSATDDTGVTGYYLSTSSASPAGSATGWVAVTSAASFTNDISYTLTSGDGTKTVYAFYKDFSENVSNASSDSIILDTTAPAVIDTHPADGSAAVAVNTAITATFSEVMDITTIGTATFTLSGGVVGTVTTSTGTTTVATFTPWDALNYNGTYTATITTGVKDLAGNAMSSNKTWSFVTVEQQITPTPTGIPSAAPTLTPMPSATPTATPVITTVVADFTASPTAGKKPLNVQFTDQSTGDISKWKWDFGDGTTDTTQNPGHTYTKKGNYTVSLAVSGRYGSDTKTIENYITVTDKKAAVIADFTATPTKGEWPLTVQFTGTSVGDITSVKWDFGDGTTSSEKNPTHVYSNAGNYTVQLTVKGKDGSDTKTITDYITVTKKDSTVTLSLSPSEITFGESLSLTGQISPATQTEVSLAFLNQNGGTDTASAFSETNGSFSLKDYFPPSGGSWEVTAGWAGDDYKDAESDPVSFTVNPAQVELTITPSSSVIQTGKTVNITGTITVTPDNETTRKKFLDEELNLLRLTPEGSYEDPIPKQALLSENKLGYQFKDVAMSDLGTWEVWTGLNKDENFAGTSSAHSSIEVQQAQKEVAGYAILVEGKVKDESGLDSHNKITSYIYRKLLERGFTDNEIYYFNFDTSQDGVDEKPSGDGIFTAIRTWASDKMNASPAPLYIILVGHGEEGKFPIYPDTLNASDLPDALDGKNGLVSRLNTNALKEPVVIIIGANRSGSFMSDLAPKSTSTTGIKRIVIASCDTKEVAYKAPLPPDETIRHGDYFVYELIKYAARGKTIKKSYELAAEKVAAYTENEKGNGLEGESAGNGQYFDDSAQHPLLDGNGDGTGTYGILSSLSGKDGETASAIILGFGTTTTPLELTEVSGVTTLEAEDTELTLYAKVSDTSKAGSVWVEITAPGHTLQSGTDATEQQVIDLPKFSYNSFDETEQKYLWNDFTGNDAFDNFSKAGAYNVFYFAQEGAVGEISSFMTSDVFRNARDNKPPTAFNPVFPVYGEETAVALKFRWEESVDPDTNEAVTYDLTVSLDEDFSEVYYQQKEMKNNFAVVDKTASLRDETSYYWKVLASDVDGGTTLMGTTTAASGNARILGYVKDQRSNPIESVDVSARMIGTSTETVTSSEEDGYFELKDLIGGRYLLKAEKELYRRYRDTLELADEETKNVTVTMRKLNTVEEGQNISSQKNSLQGSTKRARGILGTSDGSIGTATANSFKPMLANGYPGFVKGFVFDKETTEKIRKASVAAQGTKGSYKTTENGAYFMQLNSGTYTVSADASGYDTSDRKVRVDALSTTTENIGLAQATQPAGIYGQVRDKENNRPLEGVTVTVRKKAFRELTATDGEGNYSFTGLESGKYRIVAVMSGYRNSKKSIRLRAGETKTVNIRMGEQ